MMRLLIVLSTMAFGGAEIQTVELANGLAALGYEVDIAVLDHRQEIRKRVGPKIGIHVLKKKSYLDFKAVGKLKVLIGAKKPQLIMCVNLYPVLYIRLALGSSIADYRTAVSLHSTLTQNIKEQFQRSYLLLFATSMNSIIFVSNNQMDYWVNSWKIKRDKSLVIHNGIDIERFVDYVRSGNGVQKAKEMLGFNRGDVVLGNCSNFRSEKRHKDLVEACSRLRSKGYPVKLLLIGDGYMRTSIEEIVRSSSLEDEVVITGFVNDVRPYLAAVDIYVLTSDSEALPLSAIESQAMKKAAVLSCVGGASEIVVDGISGYLFPAGSVDTLVEKLETMIRDNKYEAMGEAGYHYVSEKFNRNRMIGDYDRAFRQLAEN